MNRTRIIVGIAALILLLGGVGIGVYLTQQQQDPRQRAEEPSITPTPSGPACIVDQATCEWDPTEGATSYLYKVVEVESNTVVTEGELSSNDGSLDSAATKVTFTSEPNKLYRCTVIAVNACGQGEPGEGESACTVSPTPTPTDTPSPTPTGTPSPTPTVTPTSTPTPTVPVPTPTPTTPPPPPPPPNNPPPVNTPVPTNTPIPTNTPTQIAVGPTNTPTPTIEAPGSALQAITIAGGVILTILGAIVLFVL